MSKARVAPGVQTSEFKLSAALAIVGAILEATAVVLYALQEQGVGGNVVATALVVCGVLLQVAVALGYQKSRASVKAAATLGAVNITLPAITSSPAEPKIPTADPQ